MNLVLAPASQFLVTAAFRQRPDAETAPPNAPGTREAGRVAYRDDLLCAFVGSTASFPDDLLDVPSAQSARSSVADLMRGWHPALHRAILQSDPSSVKAFELMAAAPVDPWPSDSVVLLGDAIHSMPPSAGWGTILLSATPIS